MNRNQRWSKRRAGWRGLVLLPGLMAALLCPTARAFPPAPYHLVYGQVRDRYGTPLTVAQAQVVLLTLAGAPATAPILPGLSPGVNYQLKVPMDAGQSADLYSPVALLAGDLFKMLVVIGGVTNVPIGMTAYAATLGQPGQATHIDLTLGVDANHDGLPDAWEAAFLATLGTNVPLSLLRQDLVLTADGANLRQQYLLGTYPFSPGALCKITLLGFSTGAPVLQFPTVTGRSYTLEASADAKSWAPVAFKLPGDTAADSWRNYYYSPGITTVRAYVAPPPPGTLVQFYRILVQ